MKNIVFFSFTLLLTASIFVFYVVVNNELSGVDLLVIENKLLKHELKKSTLKQELIKFHFETYRQDVAEILPEVLLKKSKGERSFPLRSLASVTQRHSNDRVFSRLGKKLFIRGQRAFRLGGYKESVKALEVFVSDYSYSRHVIEAYSLLTESYYQLGDLEKSVKFIEAMVDQFPNHELTGFALVRMGTILSQQDRRDEAGQVYMTVMEAYKSTPSLRNQARLLLSGL